MTENVTESSGSVDLGERIRAARVEARVTIRELAEATGVEQRTVARWQQGRSRPSYERLALIAQRLRKPIAFFLDGNGAAA